MGDNTLNYIYETTTQEFLSNLDIDNLPDRHEIEHDLLDMIAHTIEVQNIDRAPSRKFKIPTALPNAVIAEILLKLYPIRKVMWCDSDNNFDLMLYQSEGPNRGIYVADTLMFQNLIRDYNFDISDKMMSTVINILTSKAPTVHINSDPDLIAVNNGIFNYKTKELIPFTPDIIFTTKSNVNYNKNAKNIIIHNDEDNTDWDVDSWIDELSDDPEIINLIWQVLSAVIRPNVRWNKVVCFYSEQGNNGKGTLCELMRNICGKDRCAAIPFDKFGHEFMLEQLTRVSAIIADENTTKSFNKETGVLKAIITNDFFSINRKFKQPITMQFKGLMVQCLNDLPKFSDKSESLYRRFLFIPFEKCFTGKERVYIKDDYLNRQEVLEYILFKILNTDYYEFKEPASCKRLLNEYKTFNDPIRDFLNDTLPVLKWDLVPYNFLYDLYKSWFKNNCPSGQMLGSKTFTHDIKEIMRTTPGWTVANDPISTCNRMNEHEPLILEYNLTNWMNRNYKGEDERKLCNFVRKSSYRGLLRK